MSAQDLNRVHRRYIVVSNTFKSAWTFHQFIQGLRKVFADVPASEHPADFQSVYGELKVVADNLSETSVDIAGAQLDQVADRLMPLLQELLAVDARISPALLRQFFQRVKSFDQNILTQLVKFYLYSRSSDGWDLDRLDKADFLATKAAEEFNENRAEYMLVDRTRVRELAQGFWSALAVSPVPAEVEEAYCREIQALDQQIRSIDSIEDLHHHDLIRRYRELKHSLGDAFFQPRVWFAILDVNLALKNRVQQLYRRDEQRIIAEYQQIFELERDVPVDVELGEELSQFRVAVERFERQLQGDNIRLAELAELRKRVRKLVPKLQPETAPAREQTPLSTALDAEVQQGERWLESEIEERVVETYYRAIVAALDDTNPTLDAKKVSLQPEIFALGLGPREVVAYRRLFGAGEFDRDQEQFVLRAAALRGVIEHEVEEIKGILDDTAATQNSPIFVEARQTVRLGDLFLRRFEHRIELAVLSGDAEEAQSLQILKMRMMRGYSGLWLLVHRAKG